MKILILGGAGAMARVMVRDLLDSEGVERVGLADIKLDRVSEAAKKLGDGRVEALHADAKDTPGLRTAMKGWDVVVNSTWYELNLGIMGAAIGAGIHYLDLGGLYHMTLKQLAMDSAARDAGVTCILGLGSSPGVTNVMAALGAAKMSSIREVRIRVGGATTKPAPGFSPPYSFRTILDEACLDAAVLRRGKIEMVPGLSVKEEFVLPDPIGTVEGYYTLHSELATLPKNLGKGIQEMSFVVAFSPEFSKSVALLVRLGLARRDPIDVGATRVAPYDLLTKLVDSLPRAEDEAVDYGLRRVEIFGEAEGRPAHHTYDCLSGPHVRWKIGGRALGTGVPASLGAQWLARGEVKNRGVLPPEACMDPERFLRELASNGRGVTTYVDDGSSRHQL